ESLVHGTVALPEDDARVANRFRSVSAKILVGIPNDHLIKRDAHRIASVAAEVLVGKEENFFAAFEGPIHDRGGVGTGANRAAMLAGESFDGRGRVHVGEGTNLARLDRGRKRLQPGSTLAKAAQ